MASGKNFIPFVITETQAKSVPEPDEISNLIEEVVTLSSQINLQEDSDDVQKLPDFHNQELSVEKPMEMYEQKKLGTICVSIGLLGKAELSLEISIRSVSLPEINADGDNSREGKKMVELSETRSAIEIRSAVRFLRLKKNSPTEIQLQFIEIYGTSVMCHEDR
ncbi:hypothetical protein TNCV_817471 [Trichonephila clavipes]|nr:hypothetical protein TNCV_817471 [Trichonephila clavipes]